MSDNHRPGKSVDLTNLITAATAEMLAKHLTVAPDPEFLYHRWLGGRQASERVYSPVSRWTRVTRRVRFAFQSAREWLGSKIAGRDFNDDY